MLHYLGRLVLYILSTLQLCSTGYEHDLRRHLWKSREDALEAFKSSLTRGNPQGLEPAEYNNPIWNVADRQQLLRSSKNSSYNVVQNWPDPAKKLGQLSAVSLDVVGNVVVFHRGDRIWSSNSFLINNVYNERDLGPITQPTIVVFNATSGRVVQEWGVNLFYLPHGLTVDANNNVWVTDVALHQVFKFAPGGGTNPSKALFTLGVAFVPGTDESHFCKPTAVAVMSSGDFFVSDGYCNSRIMKFSKTGKLLVQWGRNLFEGAALMSEPLSPYLFSVPHALALAEDKEMLCVADRENGRIQCFSCHNGTFMMQFREMGSRVFSVAYTSIHGGLLFAVNGPEVFGGGHVSGFVRSVVNQEVMEEFSPNWQGFSNPHDVAVSKDGSQVYVVELNPYKVWKFVNGDINSSSIAAAVSTNTSAATVKTVASQNTFNFSKLEAVEMPTSGRSSAGTIATVVGIIVGIVAVFAIVIFAAVLKMRKRGGSTTVSLDNMEYTKLVE